MIRKAWNLLPYFLLALVTVSSVGYRSTVHAEDRGSPMDVGERAKVGKQFSFPLDHGSHPSFDTEWWYYTGHLMREGRKLFDDPTDFGFQLTFFRRRTGDGQSYLAHAALLDVRNQRFLHKELTSPGGAGVADAFSKTLRVWNGPWKAELIDNTQILEWNLGDYQVRLVSTSEVPPALHGEGGVSRKGDCDGCASYYYSLPRISLRGEIWRHDEKIEVHGLGWMDHEFMSNALQPHQTGWDWLSLYLKNGDSIMLFRMRETDGENFFSGTYLKDGKTTPLPSGSFRMDELDYFVSPQTSARYPVKWRVQIPQFQFDEIVSPLVLPQEVTSKLENVPPYWEGAISSESGNVLGYLELTGYTKPVHPVM
jgi:predicted secreted hydrolase